MLGPARALEVYDRRLASGADPWEMHLDLYPVVQRVLNPPFINPHLPKMYNICREFLTYLEPEEITSLVRLEVNEYARRVKLDDLERNRISDSSVHFIDIENAIQERNWLKTAGLMEAFQRQQGAEEFARRMVLLGSGYLDRSLGHSVSCTAFMLLEMLERKDQDTWHAVAALADYFCKGRFASSPDTLSHAALGSNGRYQDQVHRAVSGTGILNLHHPITLFAIEKVRFLFDEDQYNHLIAKWVQFMGDKTADHMDVKVPKEERGVDYQEFYGLLSNYDAVSVVRRAAEMIGSSRDRAGLGRFLIKALCDQYHGYYNPHNLTGLGSALWVIENWWDQPEIALGALYQFLDYFFDELRPESPET